MNGAEQNWRTFLKRTSALSVVGLTALFASVSAVAQEKKEEPAPAKEPEKNPEKAPEPQPAEQEQPREDAKETEAAPLEPLPDLDELLGLEKDKPAQGDEADPDLAELERMLTAEEASDAFARAVTQMHDVAELLRVAKDTGVRTQRTQDEILKRLDILIEQAQNSQSSSSQSQQSQPRPQQQQGQQQQQAQQSQPSDQRQGDNRDEMLPPGGQDARLNNVLDAAQAAWGSLPPRVRDVLLQGSSDRFSSLYEALTEEYYRRLAEESGGS